MSDYDEFEGAEPKRNPFNPYFHAQQVAIRRKRGLCTGCGYKPEACDCPARCDDCGGDAECVTVEEGEPIVCYECSSRKPQEKGQPCR
jgi:hypothetical protein